MMTNQEEEQAVKRQKLSPHVNNIITLSIPIDEDESIVEQKRLILRQYGLNHEQQCIQENGELSDEFMSVVRICHMTDIEIYFFEPAKDDPKKTICPYNEMRSLLYLKRTLGAKLREADASSASEEEERVILRKVYQNVIDRYTEFVSQNPMTHTIIPNMNVEDVDKLQKFLEWAAQNQIHHKKVTVEDFEGSGKGLAASEDIPHDEIIITISRKLLLCVKTALESESVGHIFMRLKEELQLDEDSLVTLFIMYEKSNPNTNWKPYFDILPATLPTYPLYFSDTALEKLNGTPLYVEVMQTKEQLQDFHDTVFPVLFEHFPDVFTTEAFTFENLVWTRAVVDTRAFSFRDMGCCMLPFVDFVNTCPYPQLESKGSYIPELDAFQLKTFADVKKGDQLFICYGPYSNRELLQYYGFITQNNEYDRYYIDFEMPETDSEDVLSQKMQLLQQFHLSLEHFFRKSTIPSKMLAALRIALMDEEELIAAKRDTDWNPFTSQSNDDRVLQTVEMTLEALIQMLEGDSNDEMGLTENERIALQYKTCQKDVLVESLRQVRTLQEQ